MPAFQGAAIHEVGLKHVTVAFKSFVPRSEMWRLELAAIGRCFYHNRPFTLDSVRVHVKDLVTVAITEAPSRAVKRAVAVLRPLR